MWAVEVWDGPVMTTRYTGPDGAKAYQLARDLFDHPTVIGRVIVVTPVGDHWQIEPNGTSRVGF